MLPADAAAFTETFTTSVAINIDLVPRMSIRNMLELRENVLKALRTCKSPKYAVLSVSWDCVLIVLMSKLVVACYML